MEYEKGWKLDSEVEKLEHRPWRTFQSLLKRTGTHAG